MKKQGQFDEHPLELVEMTAATLTTRPMSGEVLRLEHPIGRILLKNYYNSGDYYTIFIPILDNTLDPRGLLVPVSAGTRGAWSG